MTIVKSMYLGDGKNPNEAGTVYSNNAIGQMVDQINTTKIYVMDGNNIIGIVESATDMGRSIACILNISSYIDRTMIKESFISPSGLINTKAGLVIDDYSINEIHVSHSPAFYYALNLDDIDFESVMRYIEISNSTREGILNWSASKGHQLDRKQINQISKIVEELYCE